MGKFLKEISMLVILTLVSNSAQAGSGALTTEDIHTKRLAIQRNATPILHPSSEYEEAFDTVVIQSTENLIPLLYECRKKRLSRGDRRLGDWRKRLLKAAEILEGPALGLCFTQLSLIELQERNLNPAIAYKRLAYEYGSAKWFELQFLRFTVWFSHTGEEYILYQKQMKKIQARIEKRKRESAQKAKREEEKKEKKDTKARMKKDRVSKERETALANQKVWAQDLNEMVSLIANADEILPGKKSMIQRVREQIKDKQVWLTRDFVIEKAEETYFSLLNQVTQIAADATRATSRSEHPLREGEQVMSVVDLAGDPTDETHQIKVRVSKAAAERQAKYAAARLAKKERRADLQRDVDPAEADRNAAQALAKAVDISMTFATGRKRGIGGRDAASLFQSHGSQDLSDPIEAAAAHMLSVFSYSKGPMALVRNLSEIGMASHGLNYEKLSDGRQSIRVNNRYRICFNWDKQNGQWTDVWYGDYH